MINFPTVEWVEQDPATDPSGSRHLKSGGAGFLKTLGTTAGTELDFGTLNNTNSGVLSDTKLTYARVDSFGDSSGVFNMRFFLNSTSAWGLGTYRFLEFRTLHFQPSTFVVNEGSVDTPTAVPATTNLVGTTQFPEYQFGQPWMSGTIDSDASQYVYLGVFVGTDVPVGTYGGAGAGSFKYRLLYDFS